ncbi:MAG TPA: thermostable hemolysin [Porticoccaceae bacterium]|nr:thermostable hemolysin [Porticoccaceae bacterium]
MTQLPAAPQRTFSASIELMSYGPEQVGRKRIERYIALRYARRHDACINHFSPWLLAIASKGQPHAALGICPAAQQPLFLERYLNTPVEQCLAAQFRQPVARDGIVEIGNLAASDSTARRLLFAALVTVLARAGQQWLVCTATARVRCLIQAMGLPLHTLATADADRLGEDRARWGRYYSDHPQVVAGDIAVGLAAIHARAELRDALSGLQPALGQVAVKLR